MPRTRRVKLDPETRTHYHVYTRVVQGLDFLVCREYQTRTCPGLMLK